MSEGKTLDEVSDEVVAEGKAAELDRAWLDGGRTFADAFREALDERDKWARGEKKPLPVPWPEWGAIVAGVPENEPEKGGLLPGLHIVAAGTGVGKTQFAVSIAAHALEAGSLVAYFALELGAREIAARLFAEVQGAPKWSAMLRGRDGEKRTDLEARAEAVFAETARRFGVFAQPPLDTLVESVKERGRAMRAKVAAEGSPFPPLIVVDYTQLAAVGGDFEARQAVSALSKAMRDVSLEHDLVVIAISSVARSNYVNVGKDGGEAGGLSPAGWISTPDSLLIAKESGEMEYCSNTSTVILNVHRIENGRTLAALCVAKNREGFTRWAPAAFEGGRWQTPKRDGENVPDRETVAGYLKAAENDPSTAKNGRAPKGEKWFEGAWWASGATMKDGAPFVTEAAFAKYVAEDLRATADDGRKALAALITADLVQPMAGGWGAVNALHLTLKTKADEGKEKPAKRSPTAILKER
jgi:hypothetical protein